MKFVDLDLDRVRKVVTLIEVEAEVMTAITQITVTQATVVTLIATPIIVEVGAEVENVVSPKVVGDEPSLGPGPTTEAGRIAAVTRLLSLPCSRKYQVKLLVARQHPS